jgi:hypothetical protein
MATRIQAVTNRKVIGNVALRAYQVTDEAVGGNPIPYYPISNSDLVENGGQFKVSGNNPNQFLVYVTTNETPLGGSATPIYIVNATPPTPTVTNGLLLETGDFILLETGDILLQE